MNTTLPLAWERTVRRHGAARAIIEAKDGSVVTFSELDARANAWSAACVRNEALLRRRAVVFAAANGTGWFEILLGLLKAGAVPVPLDAGEPHDAQRQLAVSLRAAGLWNGRELELLPRPRRYLNPAIGIIKLTSGTTGRPLSLIFTAGQMIADGKQVTSTMGITRRDLNYALLPLGHSYGLGNLTIPLIAQGVPLVCGSAPLPHAIAADFARWKPTVFPSVPAIWRALASSEIALGSLRLGISAGAPLPPEVAREFVARFGRRLHSFYGSTETGGIAYDRTGKATLGGGVGRALRGVKLKVLQDGRMQVASAAVHTYGNRRRDGMHGAWVMPDLAAVDTRGQVTLLGRRGTTVKIAGRRVNLAEIAGRLRKLPDVREAWVGVSGGIDPVLGAVVATGRTPAELRTLLAAGTAAWKIPKKMVTVAALPLTVRGKNDTRAMHAMVFPSAKAGDPE